MAETIASPTSTGFSIDSLLLATAPPQYGPVTRRLLLRTGFLLLVMYVIGSYLALGEEHPALRAAGLSLAFPGGGFLYDAAPLLFLLTLVAMAFAVLLWWGLSAFFAVPLAWLLSVAGSAWLAPSHGLTAPDGATWDWAIPVVLLGTALLYATLLYRSRAAHRAKVASIPAMNEYLQTAQTPQPVASALQPTDLDREVLGWLYELALQPPDQFEGFDWGEQFHGGTCLRYQLAFLGESLAAYAANALPNHQQVIEPALAALIQRMTDQRVWKYWRLENFLATGRVNLSDISRILFREFRVGLVMGSICGGVVGVIGSFVFARGKPMLGVVVFVSMLAGMTAATSVGTLAPAMMKKLGIDPAIASGPFVTTANDIVGIIIYMSTALLFLDYLK